ncbi:HAD family hydrolase [Halobacteria archaeon AArc-curdl1]|uniref:HAD family hydrolase n=1 Tax=Natronosalvus hydrolyticus TaxID=2979988 RepID=A0AAP2ZBW4_9EURY|nr:HAD family hydrolase [Halobacteria archaeon AArc-curdl1]
MSDSLEAVLFDLDDTLCRYRRSSTAVLECAFERVGVDPVFDPAAYPERYGDYLASSSSIGDLHRQCFGDLAVEAGADRELGIAVAEAFNEERDQRAVDPLAGVPDVFDTLEESYRLGLITNGDPAMQAEKLEALGLTDTFEPVVCSGYDTAPKPDPEPFEVALEALDLTPEQALYVGNSLTSDVSGAQAAGLPSVWVPADNGRAAMTGTGPEPTYTIESLAALASVPSLSV